VRSRSAALLALVVVASPVLAQDDDNEAKKDEEAGKAEERALLKRAQDLIESGDQAEGFKAYEQLASLAWKNGHAERAFDALEEARKAAPSPEDKVRVVRLAGHFAMVREDYEKAVTAYRRAAKLAPDDAHVLATLGYALHLTGDEAGAIEVFERSLELDPESHEAQDALALAYRTSGRPKKALKLHQELLESTREKKLATRSDSAWESATLKAGGPKGGSHLTSQESRRAALELEVAIDQAFCDDLGKAEEGIARVQEATKKDDLTPALWLALDQTLRAIEERPKHFQLRYVAALLWEAKGEPEKARAELTKLSAAAKKLEPFVKKAQEKLGQK
jgi:cytochrome c-type biogenesis protein CcmH/NrfG